MATKARVQPPGTNTGNLIRDSALGLVPETLDYYIPLNAAVWDAGPLNAAEVEMARLRNARYTGCVMCQAVRYDIAIEAGLDEDKVSLISQDLTLPGLSAREKLIVRFVDQYALDPAGIADDFKAELSKEFSVEELVHLSLLVAYFNGFGRCAVALGGMPEQMPRMEISVPR